MPKKKYMVVKATQRDISGISVGGQEMKFGKKTNAFQINDPGLARDIEQAKGTRYTGDVVVVPYEPGPEPGHRRSFLVPDLPWKRGTEPQRKAQNGTSDD